MIALVCFLNGYFLHAVLVQQEARQVGAASRITISRFRVSLEHALHPHSGQEYDGYEHESDNHKWHGGKYYAK